MKAHDASVSTRLTYAGQDGYGGVQPCEKVSSEPWDESAPANAFERADSEYARYRPAYPASTVSHVLGGEDGRGLRVAEIGAGTGKMTRLLVERGCRVDAVEPAAAMRHQLLASVAHSLAAHTGQPHVSPGASSCVREVGSVSVVDGCGEDTGLASHSVDLVVYAQSWHWVDATRAANEAARILMPTRVGEPSRSGRIAIVFNQMNVAHPWVHRLTRIMRSGDIHTPQRPPTLGSLFTTPQLHCVEFTVAMSPSELMGLARTRSSYLKSTPENRVRMQNNLRWYLTDHLGYRDDDLVTIPYYTLTWTANLNCGELSAD